MIIDSSAIVSILLEEPDAERFDSEILSATSPLMSTATYLETAMVVESRGGPEVGRVLDEWLQRSGIELVPVTLEQAQAARDAWRRYGKGNHPAALNFGDCFVYALARTTGEPLLYKGADFAQTDVRSALEAG